MIGTKDKRRPGQSQLDYLWTTYKEYSVSNKLEEIPEEYIPTQAFVQNLIKEIESPNIKIFEIVDSLPIVGRDDKIYLIQNENGYSAYIYINHVAVLIGSVGADSELQKKVDALSTNVDNLENKLNWYEY